MFWDVLQAGSKTGTPVPMFWDVLQAGSKTGTPVPMQIHFGMDRIGAPRPGKR